MPRLVSFREETVPVQVRKMRLLRKKHHISLTDIGRFCGISKQRVQEIEMGYKPVSEDTAGRIADTFARIMEQRQAACRELYRDFQCHRETLMERVEEETYEL